MPAKGTGNWQRATEKWKLATAAAVAAAQDTFRLNVR